MASLLGGGVRANSAWTAAMEVKGPEKGPGSPRAAAAAWAALPQHKEGESCAAGATGSATGSAAAGLLPALPAAAHLLSTAPRKPPRPRGCPPPAP